MSGADKFSLDAPHHEQDATSNDNRLNARSNKCFMPACDNSLSHLWRPMISFVVPAHNEQACLGRTLQAIHSHFRTPISHSFSHNAGTAQSPVFVTRMVFSPFKMMTRRASVEKVW